MQQARHWGWVGYEMHLIDIFKTPVYKAELDLDIKKLELFCNAYKEKNEGRIVSNMGGYQSHNLPVMTKQQPLRTLVEEIEHHAHLFAKEFINDTKQEMINTWFNINGHRDFNMNHNHPGCDISGVFYVKTPVDCGNIVFVHPSADSLSYYCWEQQEKKEFNTYNSEEWWMDAVENVLYLFPGWLNHYVRPNNNKEEQRISFSFNTRAKFR